LPALRRLSSFESVNWLRSAAVGAAAGAAATVPMSAVMWVSQRAGWMPVQPPRKVTEAALDAVDAHPSEEAQEGLSVVSHFLFGAAAGTLFSVVTRGLPRPASGVPAGILYGVAVWFVSYQGWVPALKIMPPASEDRPARRITMVAAHLIFGATLAGLLRRWRRW
jgi:hypothetical protein